MSEVSAAGHDGADTFGPATSEAGGLDNPLTFELVDDELEELRRLLLAPERDHLAEVHQRVEQLETREYEVEHLSQVLPDAVALRAGQDNQLARALEPTVEETLRGSIQRDPQPFADALFPIFGPAIRKSISEALSSMLESVNRSIEHSLTVQSWTWRLEAWRTGKSFSEIVLSHTLAYRVEQVFLFDEESGTAMQHAVAEAVDAQDSSLVSSMLTAIQDFAQDSFGAGEQDTLATMQIGELTVWIEQGPHAMLAAVIRGIPAPELRTVMQDVIETIHLQFKKELHAYQGDPAPLADTKPLLDAVLLEQYKEKERKTPLALWLLLALVLAALGLWIFFSVRDNLRWKDYLSRLEAEPGLVVTETGRAGGDWFVHGLRDPLARDPAEVLAQTPLRPEDVRARWQPYQALDSALVVRRAAQLLTPPPSTTLRYEAGTLAASGTAPGAWIEEARQRARFLPGILAYDDDALEDDAALHFRNLAAALERQAIGFLQGSTRLAPGQEAALDTLIAGFRRLQAAADEASIGFRLQVLGHASAEGTAVSNQFISRQRAEAVRRALAGRGLPVENVEAVGTGSPLHERPERTEEDRAANRSVSFRVATQ